MTVSPTNLIAPQQLTNATVIYYTSTQQRTRIDKLSVTNPTATAATCTIYLVPSAGSANDGTTITAAHTVLAGETWNCPDVVGQVLLAGGMIQAKASTNTALTIMASGVQIS